MAEDPVDDLRSRLGNALSHPQSIAPMPRVCAQIADIAAQPRADALQLVRVIESDPALVGAVMRVANSPAMRLRASASSLHQAISWLGIFEVRNIALSKALRGEVFTAPGRDAECERLWREALLAALWARELARNRNRRLLETSFLAGLMHRCGAALAFKIISQFEVERQLRLQDAQLRPILAAVEPSFARLLMSSWRLSPEVQDAASGWADYPQDKTADLAGVVAGARLLALHTLDPAQLTADAVLASAVFAALGVDAAMVQRVLDRRDSVLASAEF